MPHHWPEDTDFALLELDVIDRNCPVRGHLMYIRDHRHRHFFTRDGPVHLVSRPNHCPDPRCPGHSRTKSPEIEPTIALPGWGIAWDVFCWIGHRRFSRHASTPRIRADLHGGFAIDLAVTGIANYIHRHQAMLAARQQGPEAPRRLYHEADSLILSIGGLRPEEGHEALYVVRELAGKRVWFAEALLSATADEVRRLIARAKRRAGDLGRPVALWISDKQDASATGIAAGFPAVPHRYRDDHFLRDLARPVLEADSHARVQMRKKVRGSRGIEQAVLNHRRDSEPPPPPGPESVATETLLSADPPPLEDDPVGDVVLDYCVAVRGILNDDPGGPLDPPGSRMAEASGEVRQSVQRDLDANKGDSRRSN